MDTKLKQTVWTLYYLRTNFVKTLYQSWYKVDTNYIIFVPTLSQLCIKISHIVDIHKVDTSCFNFVTTWYQLCFRIDTKLKCINFASSWQQLCDNCINFVSSLYKLWTTLNQSWWKIEENCTNFVFVDTSWYKLYHFVSTWYKLCLNFVTTLCLSWRKVDTNCIRFVSTCFNKAVFCNKYYLDRNLHLQPVTLSTLILLIPMIYRFTLTLTT